MPSRTSPTPRPTELLEIFEGKKNEIKSKLEESQNQSKSSHRLTSKSSHAGRIRTGSKDEWIAMLKGELIERSTGCKKEPEEADRCQSSVQVTLQGTRMRSFGEAVLNSQYRTGNSQNRTGNSQNRTGNSQNRTGNSQNRTGQCQICHCPHPAKSNSSSNLFGLKYQMKSRCVRCRQQVAIVDRILISGCLLHRSCLTCSKCGITLRLSEFKCNDHKEGSGSSSINQSNGSSSKGIENSFNYMCILCSKNRVNQSLNHHVHGAGLKPSPSSFGNGFHPLPKTTNPSLHSNSHLYMSSSSPSINKLNGTANRNGSSCPRDSYLKESNPKDSNLRGSSAKDSNLRGSNAKDSNLRGSSAKDPNGENITNKLPPVSPNRSPSRHGHGHHQATNSRSDLRSVSSEEHESTEEAVVDEYELRLKERMKWKANFLMNNNNIDLGTIFKENEERKKREQKKQQLNRPPTRSSTQPYQSNHGNTVGDGISSTVDAFWYIYS